MRYFEKSIGEDIDFIQGIFGDVTGEPLKFKLITPKENPIFMLNFEFYFVNLENHDKYFRFWSAFHHMCHYDCSKMLMC